MQRSARCIALILIAAGLVSGSVAWAQAPAASRWESAIATFEAADRKQAPSPNGILFIGSSSIRGWDLEQSFPELPVFNRGFGGSQIADSLHFADRIILPYQPRTVVLYAGDNDIAQGKAVEQVLADFKALVQRIHSELPHTRIVFIAIKPSIRRWALVEKMRVGNQRIRAVTESDERLAFVDIDKPMIGADGRPRAELFVEDGLHLSPEGYKLWTALVRPHLERRVP